MIQPKLSVAARLSPNADISLAANPSSLSAHTHKNTHGLTHTSVLPSLSHFSSANPTVELLLSPSRDLQEDLVGGYRRLDVIQKRMQPFAGGPDIWLREEIVTRLFADGRQV